MKRFAETRLNVATARLRAAALALLVSLACGLYQTAAAANAPAAASGYAHPTWLVGARWLQQHLHDPDLTVVALTPESDFVKGHIPGAVQIDWPALDVTDTSASSMAKWRSSVARKLTALGIHRRDTVVIYDGGTLFAARLWWVLDDVGQRHKRILDGGLPAWTAAGGALAAGASTPKAAPVPYRVEPNPSDLATLAQVKADLHKPDVVLVDARTRGEYVAGHIPGAINSDYPENALPAASHLWKSAAALRRLYATAGVTPDQTVVAYCSSGVRSAVTYFTLRLIGYPHVRLYTGSWAEWSQHPELPVATGEHR